MKSDMPIGLRFSLLHRAFLRQMDQRLLEKDLTGVQFGVLAALIRLEERGEAELSQRDLENASRVTHPTMTEIIKRLEKRAFFSAARVSWTGGENASAPRRRPGASAGRWLSSTIACSAGSAGA